MCVAAWRHQGSFIGLGRSLNSRPGRVLSQLLSVLLAVTLIEIPDAIPASAVPASAVPASAVPAAKPACTAERPDRAAAVLAARWCGGKVEIAGERSETLRVWANADGSLTAEQHTGPVRMRDGRGGWKPVDATLEAHADGSVSARAHPRGLRLSGAAGDGEHDLVTLGSGDDAVGLAWRGKLPKPTVAGTRATYADVLDGVDLVFESTRTGYEQFFVVKTRAALARSGKLSLRLKAPKLTIAPDGSGGLLFTDKQGNHAGRIPSPSMWDASIGAQSLDHLRVGAVGLSATQRGANIDLELTPDPAFLSAPDLTFPITIDPTIYPTFDTFVQTGWVDDQSGSTDLKLGYSDDGGSWTTRSFLNWDTAFLAGTQVNSATVYLWNYHSWSCTAASWEVWTTSAASSATRWTNQPTWYAPQGSSTQTKGSSSACNDGWVSAPATGLFQTGASNGWAQTTMGLKATSETNHNGWKRFHSSEGANPPYAVITFNGTPQITARSTDPSTECTTGSGRPFVNTVRPKLRAQVTDPEGSPVSATFEWWTTGGSIIGSTTVGPQASGSTFEATVPSGAFSNGGTYSWRARGTDGGTTGAYSTYCELTIDTTEPAAQPGASSTTFPANTWTGQLTGYTTSTVSAAYVPATTTLALTGDDAVQQLTLPFPIAYYGQTYSTAWIDTNGMVSFVNPNGSHPDDIVPLPNSADPNAAVYVFAQDLVVDANASVRTAVLGTAPNRQFVIEWNNPYQFGNTSRRQDAEVLFNETGSTVTFNYANIDNAYEQGSEALAGVENADGTIATQYSYHTSSLNNGTAIVFTYNAGAAPVSAGTAANFTFTPSGITDVASYQYGVDSNPPSTVVNAASLGGNATVSITPDTDGPHTLYVRSQDRAGNQSPIRAYPFNVGHGGLTSPKTGDLSAGRSALAVATSPAVAGVTYQWRRADTDTWQTIPLADVSLAAGGGAITWPLRRSSGDFPKLNWNLDTTVNSVEAGPDPLDGPLQVRALFTGGASTLVKVNYDRNQAAAATTTVGPGSANVLTGNYVVSDTDVSVESYGSDLTVTRTFNSRQAASTDSANLFGPGWVSGLAVTDADAPYTHLTVTGSLVQVDRPDGSTLGFTERTSSAAGRTYDAETGLEQLQLTYTTASDAYTLLDLDGTTVLFTKVAGAAADAYNTTAVTTAGVGQTTTVGWQKVTVNGTDVVRPTRMLAPVPTGVTCTTLVKGCRALDFTYATGTTATGTAPAQWGDSLGRLAQITFTGWDPDAGPAAMRTVVVARYSYDNNGRLRSAWDPRLDWTDSSVTPPVTRHLANTYDYNADGTLAALSPAGESEPWQLTYTTVPGDPGAGRIAQASRSALTAGTARQSIVYRVPTTGAGAPYDLSSAQTVRWGQSEQPVEATAVFDPGQVPTGNQATGVMPGSWDRATLTYTDANGRVVNTVQPGGHTAATWYDSFSRPVRTLTAGNLARALGASASDTAADEAALARRLSALDVYSRDGQELLDTFGPEHDVVLPTGAVVRGRLHTASVYDQGAPSTGGPFRLVTTSTTTVQYTASGGATVDADARVTSTGYDWNLRQSTISTEDPGGLALATRTAYDSVTGLTVSETQPAGGVSTNTPATTTTAYYRAGTGSGYAECDNHPEWANLTCRSQLGGQAATGPEVAATVTTYDLYGRTRSVVEKTTAATLRTTTNTYDGAGRLATTTLVGPAGTGEAVPTRRNIYDQATGKLARAQTLDASNAVTAETVSVYDALGRLSGYTDADANATTTTYDLLSRVATVNDGKASQTFTYDAGTERRGLVTNVLDGQAGAMSGTYDADGNLTGQTWPNGVVSAIGYDETGQPRSLAYTRPGCGQADCTLYAETIAESVHGQQRLHSSTLSGQAYAYDNAGRLTTVNDTVNAACGVRVYAYSTATNRTGLTRYGPGSGGACQTSTVAGSTTWTYDTANRINTTGYTYDSLGRATTVPATDTGSPGGGNLTATYHVNDMARTVAQGGRTTTYTLDVGRNRVRSWTDNDSATTTTRTNHYGADTDSPSWTDEGASAWTRVVGGVGGLAAITSTNGTTDIDWQLANLHGDLVATIHNIDVGLSTTGEATEYGESRDPTDTGSRRYGWLGAHQRAADTPSGVVLMGVRLYNPTTGRFLQVDPIASGSCGAYDYVCCDPLNNTDLKGTSRDRDDRDGLSRCRNFTYELGNGYKARLLVKRGKPGHVRVDFEMYGPKTGIGIIQGSEIIRLTMSFDGRYPNASGRNKQPFVWWKAHTGKDVVPNTILSLYGWAMTQYVHKTTGAFFGHRCVVM